MVYGALNNFDFYPEGGGGHKEIGINKGVAGDSILLHISCTILKRFLNNVFSLYISYPLPYPGLHKTVIKHSHSCRAATISQQYTCLDTVTLGGHNYTVEYEENYK